MVSLFGAICSLVMYCLKKNAMIVAHDPKYFDYIEDGVKEDVERRTEVNI